MGPCLHGDDGADITAKKNFGIPLYVKVLSMYIGADDDPADTVVSQDRVMMRHTFPPDRAVDGHGPGYLRDAATFPDSHDPRGLCSRCWMTSSFDLLGTMPLTLDAAWPVPNERGDPEPDVVERVAILRCRSCGGMMAVVEEKWIGRWAVRDGRQDYGGEPHYRGVIHYPFGIAPLDPAIPETISSAFVEAAVALVAGCPRASAAMARRTLEAIATAFGAADGALFARIEGLASRGVLPQTLADWAHEVRLVGNTGAHFDPIEDVAVDDAREMLGFLRELMHYLYVLPAELKRRRKGG